MDALADLVPIAQLSATGALLLVIVLLIRAIVRGDFVPKRELDYLRSDRDAAVARADQRADDYKAAHTTSEHARELQAESIRELLEQGRTSNHLLEAVHRMVEEGPRDVG